MLVIKKEHFALILLFDPFEHSYEDVWRFLVILEYKQADCLKEVQQFTDGLVLLSILVSPISHFLSELSLIYLIADLIVFMIPESSLLLKAVASVGKADFFFPQELSELFLQLKITILVGFAIPGTVHQFAQPVQNSCR